MSFIKAEPVWKKNESETLNQTCVFYVRFSFAEKSELHIACCNVYKAYLNGEFIACGPARSAHGTFRKDVIELNNLQKENILFIEVAAYNTINFCHLNAAGFLQAEIVCDKKAIKWSGRDFFVRSYFERLQKVPRYSYQRAFIEVYDFKYNPQKSYLVTKSDEALFETPEIVVGGRIIERGVGYSNYELYKSVIKEKGRIVCGEKVKRRNRFTDNEKLKIFPQQEWDTYAFDEVGGMKYEKDGIDELSEERYAVFDFNAIETGLMETAFYANEKSKIYIIFDGINLTPYKENQRNNIILDCYRDGSFNIVEYRVEKGAFSHITMEPYSFRYAKILVVEGLISNVNLNIIGCENSNTKRFKFSCEDKTTEKIVEAGVRTFNSNALDILTDCPSRERAGWLCDSYFISKTEQLLTGSNSVENSFLENYYLAPELPNIPKGMVPMCYPSDFVVEEYIPNWALWYIVELYDNYLRTDNDKIIMESKKKVYDLLEYFEQFKNDDGLLENLKGWIFVEWSKANDSEFVKGVNYPTNMMYVKALRCIGRMYGDKNCLVQAENIREKIIIQSYNGEFFEDNRVRIDGKLSRTGNISETCQYYAFFCEVASLEDFPQLHDRLIKEFGDKRDVEKVYPFVYKSNAFIGNYLRLLLLFNGEYVKRIPEECYSFFSKMAEATGTLWEHSGPYGSLNHGFASYAINIISAYLTGYVGRCGKKLMFRNCLAEEECEIHFPIADKEMIFTRNDKGTFLKIPEGFHIVKV